MDGIGNRAKEHLLFSFFPILQYMQVRRRGDMQFACTKTAVDYQPTPLPPHHLYSSSRHKLGIVGSLLEGSPELWGRALVGAVGEVEDCGYVSLWIGGGDGRGDVHSSTQSS